MLDARTASFIYPLVSWACLFVFVETAGRQSRNPRFCALTPEHKSGIVGYVCSTIHAVLAVAISLFVWNSIQWDDSRDAFNVRTDPLIASGAGGTFCGYLIVDVVHMQTYDPATRMKGLLMALHHTVFAAAVVMFLCSFKGDTIPFVFLFPLFYIAELSTIFMNLRQIFRLMHWGKTWFTSSVDLCFAMSFLGTRIGAMGYGVAMTFAVQDKIRKDLPFLVQAALLFLLPLGFAMNLYWSTIVIRNVANTIFGYSAKKRKRTASNNEVFPTSSKIRPKRRGSV